MAVQIEASTALRSGQLAFHPEGQQGRVGVQRLALSDAEYRLLAQLASEPGRPFGRRELLTGMWGRAWQADTEALSMHIHRLRSKLRAAGVDPVCIRTVHGRGYLLDPVFASGAVADEGAQPPLHDELGDCPVELLWDHDFTLRSITPRQAVLGWRPSEILDQRFVPLDIDVQALRGYVCSLLDGDRTRLHVSVPVRDVRGATHVVPTAVQLLRDLSGVFSGIRANIQPAALQC